MKDNNIMTNNEKQANECKNIGVKRDSKIISNNFIFRRVLNAITEGTYEEFSSIYQNMLSFDWEDERLQKLKANPGNNLTPTAYWFYICSNYFPFCSNEFSDKENYNYIEEQVNKVMEKVMNSKQNSKHKSLSIANKRNFIADMASVIDSKVFIPVESQTKNNISNPNNLNQNNINTNGPIQTSLNKLSNINDEDSNTDDMVIQSEMYKLELPNSKKQTSIDHLITKLSGSLTDVSARVKANLNEIKNNMKANRTNLICTDFKEYDSESYDKNNLNLDMQFISYSKNKYFKYLNQRHDNTYDLTADMGNKKILSKFEEEQSNVNADDIVCSICNDGDYEDNDLIVFCSECNIAVHQLCYGILIIPKDDWICDTCQVFGKTKAYELECLLCPIKGGAMKSCIKKSNIDCRIIMQIKNIGVTKKLIGEIIQEEKRNQEINVYSDDSDLEVKNDMDKNTEKNTDMDIDDKNDKNTESNVDKVVNLSPVKMDSNSKSSNTSRSRGKGRYSSIKSVPKLGVGYKSRKFISNNIFKDDFDVPDSIDKLNNQYNQNNQFNQFNQNIQSDSPKVNCLLNSELSNQNPNINLNENENKNLNDNTQQKLGFYYSNTKQSKISYDDSESNDNNDNNEDDDIYTTQTLTNTSFKQFNSQDLINNTNTNLSNINSIEFKNPLKSQAKPGYDSKIKFECSPYLKDMANDSNYDKLMKKKRRRPKNNTPKKKLLKSTKFSKNKQEKTMLELLPSRIKRLKNPENYSWVHISCAQWIPEITFGDKDRNDDIRDIDKIEKKRWEEYCHICTKKYVGPTVKCDHTDCNIQFHVECARINKYYLEQPHKSVDGGTKHIIFCQVHRPQKLLKALDLKKQRIIEEIKHFGKILLKNYDCLSKYNNEFVIKSHSQHIHKKIVLKKPILLKKIKKKIISQVRDIVLKISNINVVIKRKHKKLKELLELKQSKELIEDEQKEKAQKLTDKDKNYFDFGPKQNNGLSYFQTLNPITFPWYMVKIEKMKTKDIYNQYLHIIPDQVSFDRHVFKRIEKKSKNKRRLKNKLVNVIRNNSENNNTIQDFVEDNNLYCYCCDSEDKCLGFQWYHQACVYHIKDLSIDIIESPDFIFVCKECDNYKKGILANGTGGTGSTGIKELKRVDNNYGYYSGSNTNINNNYNNKNNINNDNNNYVNIIVDKIYHDNNDISYCINHSQISQSQTQNTQITQLTQLIQVDSNDKPKSTNEVTNDLKFVIKNCDDLSKASVVSIASVSSVAGAAMMEVDDVITSTPNVALKSNINNDKENDMEDNDKDNAKVITESNAEAKSEINAEVNAEDNSEDNNENIINNSSNSSKASDNNSNKSCQSSNSKKST